MSSDIVALPSRVFAFLDGTDLCHKVGYAIELAAVDSDGWPRLVLLSVGEVLAVSAVDLRLALLATSGTAQAVTRSKKVLLSVVLDETRYRVRARVEQVTPAPRGDRLAHFRGRVISVDEDRVEYARVVDGITYTLNDEEAAVARWEKQIGFLRRVEDER